MDSKVTCICDDLEEIKGFHSLSEYKRFLSYIEDRMRDHDLFEIAVESQYANSKIFIERWFECVGCSQRWRLVAPDFPFKGLWEKL